MCQAKHIFHWRYKTWTHIFTRNSWLKGCSGKYSQLEKLSLTWTFPPVNTSCMLLQQLNSQSKYLTHLVTDRKMLPGSCVLSIKPPPVWKSSVITIIRAKVCPEGHLKVIDTASAFNVHHYFCLTNDLPHKHKDLCWPRPTSWGNSIWLCILIILPVASQLAVKKKTKEKKSVVYQLS